MQLKINDYVYYALNGICLVKEVKRLNLEKETKDYYVLAPINNSSTFFIPVDNKDILSKIKKVLTKDEIDKLIIESKKIEIEWPNNSKDRQQYIHQLLIKDDLKITLAIIRKIIEMKNLDKKISTNDLVNLSNAQNLVETSLSYSLNMSKEEVREYILNSLKQCKAHK